MVEQGQKISREMAEEIQNAGINSVDVLVEDKVVRVIGNNFVDLSKHVSFDIDELNIKELVHYPTLKEILDNFLLKTYNLSVNLVWAYLNSTPNPGSFKPRDYLFAHEKNN